jgi:ribosomal protein L31
VVNTTEKFDSTSWDSPPPSSLSSRVKLIPESVTGKEVELSQQQFNTTSTVIQHPLKVDVRENAHNQNTEIDTETQEFIQHITREEGERGYVEQIKLDGVLQNEQIVTFAIAQQDISSQTNSLDQTSQQEAFQQKYQPVEVLNSEGEWISGYWVHKCLVVANLEGVERKYALYDESGAVYVFWGEIRLPRVKAMKSNRLESAKSFLNSQLDN